MKPKQTQPPRPLPLLRRAFLSSLDPPQVRARLEEQAFSRPALATMFLLPEGETALRVTGTGLHGDMFLAFQPDGGAHALTVARPAMAVTSPRLANVAEITPREALEQLYRIKAAAQS